MSVAIDNRTMPYELAMLTVGSTLSSAEAETLHHRIKTATTEQDIAAIWADLDDEFQILDEDQWTR